MTRDLVLEHITYVNGRTLLDDVSVTFPAGRVTALSGPSGSGKTTLLSIAGGLLEPTSGTAELAGQEMWTGSGDPLPEVAFVLQVYGLVPILSARENVSIALRARGTAPLDADEAAEAALARFGIADLGERQVEELSGGQMQRVALGRALVRDPDVFLLDEPLSNLDAKLRVKMREEITTLHARLRATMIFVTHDQVEAMTLGDRIVIMRDGVIQQAGKPLELYDRPANTFVAGFIGSPEMNLIDGHLVDASGRLEVRSGDLSVGIPDKTFAKYGQSVTLGIRPEHLVISNDSPLEMSVSLVEQIGAQTYLMGTLAGHKMRAVVERRDEIRAGDRIPIALPSERLHLFE